MVEKFTNYRFAYNVLKKISEKAFFYSFISCLFFHTFNRVCFGYFTHISSILLQSIQILYNYKNKSSKIFFLQILAIFWSFRPPSLHPILHFILFFPLHRCPLWCPKTLNPRHSYILFTKSTVLFI